MIKHTGKTCMQAHPKVSHKAWELLQAKGKEKKAGRLEDVLGHALVGAGKGGTIGALLGTGAGVAALKPVVRGLRRDLPPDEFAKMWAASKKGDSLTPAGKGAARVFTGFMGGVAGGGVGATIGGIRGALKGLKKGKLQQVSDLARSRHLSKENKKNLILGILGGGGAGLATGAALGRVTAGSKEKRRDDLLKYAPHLVTGHPKHPLRGKEKKAGKTKTILVEGLKGAGLGAAVGTTRVGVGRALEIRKSFAKQLKKLEDEGHVERAAKLRLAGDKEPIAGIALKEGLVGGGVPGALLGGAVGLTRGIKKVKSQQRAELQQIAEVLRGKSLSKKKKLLTALGVGGGLTAGAGLAALATRKKKK